MFISYVTSSNNPSEDNLTSICKADFNNPILPSECWANKYFIFLTGLILPISVFPISTTQV